MEETTRREHVSERSTVPRITQGGEEEENEPNPRLPYPQMLSRASRKIFCLKTEDERSKWPLFLLPQLQLFVRGQYLAPRERKRAAFEAWANRARVDLGIIALMRKAGGDRRDAVSSNRLTSREGDDKFRA